MKKLCLIFLFFATSLCNADEPVELPLLSTYSSYKAFYQALHEELSPYILKDPDQESIIKLASDSTTDIVTLRDGEFAYIIKTNYFENGNSVRGASGNGGFYILQPIGRSLKLVGRFSGTGYKINFINSIPIIDVFFRGAEETEKYIWDGTIFKKNNDENT